VTRDGELNFGPLAGARSYQSTVGSDASTRSRSQLPIGPHASTVLMRPLDHADEIPSRSYERERVEVSYDFGVADVIIRMT
jgi:hypothetical protein